MEIILAEAVEKENVRNKDLSSYLSYHNLLCLFMIGNLVGVCTEGVWCYFFKGAWETHVITVWGPFCLIYGIGLAVLYILSIKLYNKSFLIKFLAAAVILDIIEYISSWLIDYFLDMRAWDYSSDFMNINGRICISMTIIWGLAGVLFACFLIPQINKVLDKIQGKGWKIAIAILSAFMLVNMLVTAASIVRWSQRHNDVSPRNVIERKLDDFYDDDFMQRKFIEWSFIR